MSERNSLIYKRNFGEIEFEETSIKRMKLEVDNDERTVPSSSDSDHHRSFSSDCSSSETNEIATNTGLPFLDLEVGDHQVSEETEISTLLNNNLRGSEMESGKTKKKTEKKEKAPTEAEIEEFFKAAESNEQRRFTEKYNYDIVNDTPLEGRYEWVRLNP